MMSHSSSSSSWYLAVITFSFILISTVSSLSKFPNLVPSISMADFNFSFSLANLNFSFSSFSLANLSSSLLSSTEDGGPQNQNGSPSPLPSSTFSSSAFSISSANSSSSSSNSFSSTFNSSPV